MPRPPAAPQPARWFRTDWNGPVASLSVRQARARFEKSLEGALSVCDYSYYKRLVRVLKAEMEDYDVDDSGTLSKEELTTLFASNSQNLARFKIWLNRSGLWPVDELFRRVDTNKDQQIDYNEMMAAIQLEASAARRRRPQRHPFCTDRPSTRRCFGPFRSGLRVVAVGSGRTARSIARFAPTGAPQGRAGQRVCM